MARQILTFVHGPRPKNTQNMSYSIQNRRKALKITTTRAAEELNMNVRTYQRKEKDEGFDIKEFRRLAKLLNIQVLIVEDSITIL